MHHQRAIELGGEIGLVRRTEVIAIFELLLEQALGMRAVQHSGGFIVGDPGKGRLHAFEFRRVAPQHLQVEASAG